MKTRKVASRNERYYYDPYIVVSVALLLTLGLIMVGSASMVISDKQYGFSLYYVIKQAVFIVIGFCAAYVASRITVKTWESFSGYFFLISIVLLIVVLIPGIGRMVNGSRRWINFGLLSLQVSEFVKLSSILYLSRYLTRFKLQVQQDIIGFVKPLVILMIIGMLLLLEPDFGAFIVIGVCFFSLLFVAGARLMPFMVILLGGVLLMVGVAVLSPYRLLRITTFMHPWHVAFGSGYQLTQSLIGFGRGGIFGVGLGNSIQKLFYLPEAHSDFIFAVIAEELGLIGALLFIALIVAFVWRMLFISRQARQHGLLFSSYVTCGAACWIGWQSFINIGVNIGILPTKGLTLPFISYGGSSMLVSCLLVGIVTRIFYEMKCQSLLSGKKPVATVV